MERGALVLVFPNIWLLICKFHLCQSWRNHRNKLLKGKTPVHVLLKKRMKTLEDTLVATVTISEARNLVAAEVKVLMEMSTETDIAKKGVEHLAYLRDYWTTDALWQCWSDFGRRVAAEVLKCSFEGVLPTTNHLESFNGVLKQKHLCRWQHGGPQVCFDMLINLLITKILPSNFQQRTLQQQDDLRFKAQLHCLCGGEALLAAQQNQAPNLTLALMAYLLPDERQDAEAMQLVKHKQISTP